MITAHGTQQESRLVLPLPTTERQPSDGASVFSSLGAWQCDRGTSKRDRYRHALREMEERAMRGGAQRAMGSLGDRTAQKTVKARNEGRWGSEPCRFWTGPHGCMNGEACRWSHSAPIGRSHDNAYRLPRPAVFVGVLPGEQLVEHEPRVLWIDGALCTTRLQDLRHRGLLDMRTDDWSAGWSDVSTAAPSLTSRSYLELSSYLPYHPQPELLSSTVILLNDLLASRIVELDSPRSVYFGDGLFPWNRNIDLVQ